MKSHPFKVGQIYREDVLQDGETLRRPLMLKDAARFCDFCSATGKIKDASIRCPVCGGSGMLNANGQGVDVDEVARATSNNTEGARGGEFGTDHASLSDADMRVKDYMLDQQKYAQHRPGFKIDSSPEGRAARAKVFDAMAEHEQYLTSAWQTLPSNVAPPSITADTNTDLRRAPDQADHRTTDQIAKDHQLRMAEETRLYENSVANAYKTLR